MNQANHQNGRIVVAVRGPTHAGMLPSRGHGDAHAGCGVVLRASRNHWVTARSFRRSAEQCRVFSGVTGAVALAEGGTEMTVLEGDRLLDVAQDKRFRIRLNPSFWGSGEHEEYDSHGFGTGAPIEVRWFMQAGHTYTLNVGAWVLAEWTHGPHAGGTVSGAGGSVVADALAITLFHG
jgi:hypothetical protein